MTAVRKVFGERVISQDLWPPRSPDLTPPNFYLWVKLKGLVYADNPRSINDLKHNIRKVIADSRCGNCNKSSAACVGGSSSVFKKWHTFPATVMIS